MTRDDATATPRPVVRRFAHLLRNAALGLAVFAGYVVANRLADDMTGTDGFACLFVFAFPIGAWVSELALPDRRAGRDHGGRRGVDARVPG